MSKNAKYLTGYFGDRSFLKIFEGAFRRIFFDEQREIDTVLPKFVEEHRKMVTKYN